MSKICPLFSGSTGNSTYIEGATGAVLADVGMSCKAGYRCASICRR